MSEYTEEMHAKCLLLMLESDNPCKQSNCPVYFYRLVDELPPCDYGDLGGSNEICKAFVGLLPDDACPCYRFGGPEAIKRTWLALEAKGYLE